nr:hypothetical protein [uncultured Porphyromonas sp.]
METTTENLSKALLDVRRAHRILYAYQRRMLDLVHFIQSKLDMPVEDLCGFKHFSRPISKKGNLTIWHDMWAWDYLYSYLFEYYLGEKETDNGGAYALSLIQYSDTGYFDQEGKEEGTRLELEKFKPEEESSSKLLFFLEYKRKDSKWEWGNGTSLEKIVLDKKVGSKKHEKEVRNIEGVTQILYPVSLEEFINIETTLEVLREFRSYCQEQEIHVFDGLILEQTCTPTSSSSEE